MHRRSMAARDTAVSVRYTARGREASVKEASQAVRASSVSACCISSKGSRARVGTASDGAKASSVEEAGAGAAAGAEDAAGCAASPVRRRMKAFSFSRRRAGSPWIMSGSATSARAKVTGASRRMVASSLH